MTEHIIIQHNISGDFCLLLFEQPVPRSKIRMSHCVQDFLESEGVVLNPAEECPADPYTAERVERLTVKMMKTPSDFDKLRQFLEMDRKVLRFYCMLDDRDRLFGQFKKFIIHVCHVTLCHYLLAFVQQLESVTYIVRPYVTSVPIIKYCCHHHFIICSMKFNSTDTCTCSREQDSKVQLEH